MPKREHTWATLFTNPPPMIIVAGCTLYDTNLDCFRIDGTIEISTQGQILLLGKATFGGELSIGASVLFQSQPGGQWRRQHPLFDRCARADGASTLCIPHPVAFMARPYLITATVSSA